MIEFDPNNQKKAGAKVPVYATYIPSRSPQFKTYHMKNHATASMNYRAATSWGLGQPSILYQMVEGQWVEIDRYEPPTECAHCGGTFEVTSTWSNRTYKSANSLYKHPAKPLYKRPCVCDKCYNNHFTYNSPNPIKPEWCGQVQPIES